MAPSTNAGDVITIPAHSAESEASTITFTWSQKLRNRTETYYVVKGANTAHGGAETLVFIQKDFYAPGHFAVKDGAHRSPPTRAAQR